MNIIQVPYHKKNYKHKKLRDVHLRKGSKFIVLRFSTPLGMDGEAQRRLM